MTEELSLKIDKELAEFKKQLIEKYSPKPEFEVDRWDYFEINDLKAVAKFSKLEDDKYYYKERQFLNTDKWPYYMNDYILVKYYRRPASPEEVKQAIVKHCDRLYGTIKHGDKFKDVDGDVREILLFSSPITEDDWIYHDSEDRLTLRRFELYKQGQWAEIIKEEVIKIGGYNLKVEGDVAVFGCKNFTADELTQLKHIMHENDFKTVQFDKYEPVTLETINSILNKLK